MNCFGKPLDKRECMSNWENNPLRKEQLKYAALDAYILIKIHDYIQNKCTELDIKFDYTTRNALL
jgi:ribonuclease D